MILNAPTPEGISEASLSAYFSAWDKLIDLYRNFAAYFDYAALPNSEKFKWGSEWTEYQTTIQRDLQSVLTLMQQSNELALKAKICAVSPYLLLIESDQKFSKSVKVVEFSDLRTLHAVDLPGAVNSFTQTPVPDKFITTYNKLREKRNRIMHLGRNESHEDIFTLFYMLVELYIDLWPDSYWLVDRTSFLALGIDQFFDGDGVYSITGNVLGEWEFTQKLFSARQFKKLFGIEKTTNRYACHHCVDEAITKHDQYYTEEIKTAYLSDEGSLRCLLCNFTSDVTRKSCVQPDCSGNVIASIDEKFSGYCHSCLCHSKKNEDHFYRIKL